MEENNFREVAEKLWWLLDTIDSAGEMARPDNYESFLRYLHFIQKYIGERRKYFVSDGYKLFTPDEWKTHQERENQMMRSMLRKYEPTIQSK